MDKTGDAKYNAIIHAGQCGLLEIHAFEIKLRPGDSPECMELVFRIEWREGSIRRESSFMRSVPLPDFTGDVHYNLVIEGDDPWKARIGVVFWEDQRPPSFDAEILWTKEFKDGKLYFGV